MELNLEEILKLRFKSGDLIWMWFRFQVLNESKLKKSKGEKVSKIIKLFNFIGNLKYIFFKKKKIIFITSTYFNFKTKENYYINTQDKPYFDVFPEDTQIYEYPDINMKYRTPNKPKFSSFLFIIEVFCLILAKIFPTIEREEQIKFNKLVFNKIKLKDIRKAEKHIKFLRKGYKLFLKITRPQIIFINCASYGNKQGLLVKVAKELGIKVAETQHGIIYEKHFAYNYVEQEKKYLKKYFPDYILLYGEYWKKKMNIPTNLEVIGNYKVILDEEINENRYDYIVVSQWDITNLMLDLTINIRKKFKKAKILFRLHPLERLTFEEELKLKENNIEISKTNIPIEIEIKNSLNVVGCYSTVLMEVLISKKKIFILDNELSKENFPSDIGIRVNKKFEILKIPDEKIDYNVYWQEDFDVLYKKFIEKF